MLNVVEAVVQDQVQVHDLVLVLDHFLVVVQDHQFLVQEEGQDVKVEDQSFHGLHHQMIIKLYKIEHILMEL
jgi:hypothetical protein